MRSGISLAPSSIQSSLVPSYAPRHSRSSTLSARGTSVRSAVRRRYKFTCYLWAAIYTDGACYPNPGPGGWAALLLFASQEQILTGSELETTNNRMELTAAIQELKTLSNPSQVDFGTDSQYLRRGITEWIPNWQAHNWRRKGGQ